MCFMPINAIDAYWGCARSEFFIPEKWLSNKLVCFFYDFYWIPAILVENRIGFGKTYKECFSDLIWHLKILFKEVLEAYYG